METKTVQSPRIHITEMAAANWRVYEKEIATYLRELPRLLSEGKAGHYALIKADDILGVWDEQEGAIDEGCRRFGLAPICVKKIDGEDPARFALFFEAIKNYPAD